MILDTLLTPIKRAVPAPVKKQLRSWERELTLRRALGATKKAIRRRSLPSQELLSLLYRAWGNEGWSGKPDHLATMLYYARQTKGPILDCGSGISTILLGILADFQDRQLFSLEHHPGWAEKVGRTLRIAGVESTILSVSPLKDYGDFAWYDLPALPSSIGFVSCDGPPGDTKGGRYGLLPLLFEKLAPGCAIILDDTDRLEEQGIAQRWESEFGLITILRDRFSVFEVPQVNAAAPVSTPRKALPQH
jgi:hypothetical protein